MSCKAKSSTNLRFIHDNPRQLYTLALVAYMANNYLDASHQFYKLAEITTTDFKLRRKALFGLACTSLAMANSDEEYRNALTHWYNWSMLLPSDLEQEDPRLITPLLSRLQLQGIRDDRSTIKPGFEVNIDPCTRCRAVRDLSRIKKELKQKTEEAAFLRKSLAAIQNQLNNLERLHQEIELRKKKVE